MINYEGKYNDFFDIDENYFPCIDDSALNSGVDWTDTFPHKSFLDLLKGTERMLSGSTKRSLWIHGAYGTGKSKCAYALRKILEVSENELKEYWDSYDNLINNPDLFNKICGHKNRGILTCYRYASGGITTPKQLFFAIEETIKNSLKDKNYDIGVESLKETVISWLSDDANKIYFDLLLKKPEWNSIFSQNTSDEVLSDLKSNKDVKNLMDNIFSLADEVGIHAINLDADKLKDWIKAIIRKNNNLKIVFIWDEFSGFFKQNKNSLDEFQKIVSLCEEVPFYLVVVTHQTGSLMNDDDQSWQVVKQRFEFSEITLPPNIAFELIGHAFKVKKASEDVWNQLADSLNTGLSSSRTEVMKAAQISNPKVIKDIMPIHPMAALVLKNIATSFQSNQRSMFDFIKTNSNEEVHAFQWFINNTRPIDSHPLLTIDLLWNFFYEHGKDNLSSDIRMILDTYNQQKNLRLDEQTILKTILIMQAIDKRLGGEIDVLKPTEKNIALAFEGISDYEGSKCINIAKNLKNKGILVLTPIGNNIFSYGAAVLAGDQSEIDKYKVDIKKTAKTINLVEDGDLKTLLSLNPALKLRFSEDISEGDLIPVTSVDFTRVMNQIRNRESNWHFSTVIAFAKDHDEAVEFRKMIKEAAKNDEYKNIIIIDALSTPLDPNDFNEYIEHSAMASYYTSRNKQSAEEYKRKAKTKLSVSWKNRIYSGQFIVYHSGNRDGEIAQNGSAVSVILQKIVERKFPYVFDFHRGVTENQLKLTQAKVSAKCALDLKTANVMIGAEKVLLKDVWTVDNYWNQPDLSSLPISIIKNDVEKIIQNNFSEDGTGRVGIEEIYSCLESKYGFAPCNLTAFICAFLIKEYSIDPFRYLDSNGLSGTIDHDKLSEMIKNYMDLKKSVNSYIVKMTQEEMSFYSVSKKVWKIDPSLSLSSPEQASISIKNAIRKLKLPVWSLEYVDDFGVYNVIEKYIKLIQNDGPEAHKIAVEIGNIALKKPSLSDHLSDLITNQNCQIGMKNFIQNSDAKELITLASKLGINEKYISDISDLFSVESSSLWRRETGIEQIKNLINEYKFVEISNNILNVYSHSKDEALQQWRDRLRFFSCSAEGLKSVMSDLTEVWNMLLKIYQRNEILPNYLNDVLSIFDDEKEKLKNCLDDEEQIFMKLYEPYLDGVIREEIKVLKQSLSGIFSDSKTIANSRVKNAVEEYLKNQTKSKLFNIWKERTNSKSPAEWSMIHKTPILLMFNDDEYTDAKKTFEVLNRGNGTEIEIENALAFVEKSNKIERINDEETVTKAFKSLLGKYSVILTDYNKVRNSLDRLAIDPYEWSSNPVIKKKLEEMATAEYNAGGSDLVLKEIEKMPIDELKKYLVDLIKEKVDIGLEILNGGK